MTEKEIEIVLNALAGTPTLTTSEFANKVEKILRDSIKMDSHIIDSKVKLIILT